MHTNQRVCQQDKPTLNKVERKYASHAPRKSSVLLPEFGANFKSKHHNGPVTNPIKSAQWLGWIILTAAKVNGNEGGKKRLDLVDISGDKAKDGNAHHNAHKLLEKYQVF